MNLFSNFTLKIMAIILMAMDHIYTYIGMPTSVDVPIWFGYLGKLSAPIFFYLIVEGFFYTRSRKKYVTRLFSMGVVMIFVDSLLGITNNIFLHLGFGVSLLSSIEYMKSCNKDLGKSILGVVFILVSFIGMLVTEGSIFGVGSILIFYFLREKKFAMSVAYISFSLFWVLTAIGPNFLEQIFINDYQWMMVFAIVPILMYNGKLGISNKFTKWLFYVFYPLHLIVIVSIGHMIGYEPIVNESVQNTLMQQVVTKIDANISYVDDKTIGYSLKGDFKRRGKYSISVYEFDTKEEIAFYVEQLGKATDKIEGEISIPRELGPNFKLNKDKEYILSVSNIDNGEILFENKIPLN